MTGQPFGILEGHIGLGGGESPSHQLASFGSNAEDRGRDQTGGSLIAAYEPETAEQLGSPGGNMADDESRMFVEGADFLGADP
jgi:hypothetical protein